MVLRHTPLAQQVMQEILAGIEAGSLGRADGLLPSETQLGQRFQVSRATIREALAQLEQRGIIVRRHGVGTFVASPPAIIEAGLEVLESLDAMARRMGIEAHMADVAIQERRATPGEAKALQVPLATPVLSVARAIVTGGRPAAYLVDVVPTAFLRQGDLDAGFSGSVLDILLQRGEPSLSHSRADILAEAATAPIARRLHLRHGATLLKLQAQLIARDGRVVDYSLSYFVPGYFRFHVIRRIGQTNNL